MRRFILGAVLALGALVTAHSGAHAQTMGFAEAAQAFEQACGRDIDRFCRNVNLGSGRVESCLRRNDAQISDACRTAIPQIRARVAARLVAQRTIFRSCDRAAAQFCQGVRQGNANILNCLLQARGVVGDTCNTAIDNAGWR